MVGPKEDFVFCALGGLGEIGMNAALYGYGPPAKREWILVDCGVSFAGDELPGVDLVLPDLKFIEGQKARLKGIIITHAHEDHIGALMDLYPKLGAPPVYATPFAAGLFDIRRQTDQTGKKIKISIMNPGDRLELGAFNVEIVPVAHSIPESTALAIRTPLGTVVHTGDWKIDAEPVAGWSTDAKRLTELGDEGVLALVCDSTNVMREGESLSETDVAKGLAEVIAKADGRVAVTTFASNIARIRSIALAAKAAGREVIAVGRAMDRAIQVATECGYLDGVPEFRSAETYGYLPRDKVVALLTGSQGEPRAALARVAEDQHPDVTLAAGDTVIFSSRTIPGNEKAVGRIINGLVRQGVKVVTDRTALVHVSGHPRRGELKKMYEWVRPKLLVPAHGEPLHLDEHRKYALSSGIPDVVMTSNGDIVRLAPGDPSIVDEAPHGRLFKDGDVLVPSADPAVPERRKLAFAGIVSVAIAIDVKGELVGAPAFAVSGIPQMDRAGRLFEDLIEEAVFEVLDGLPKAKRRDPDLVETAIEKAVRSTVNGSWGKKPVCHVQVVVI
jgi:ribonuclease J